MSSPEAQPMPPAAQTRAELTSREREVTRWVAQGKTDGEIGTIVGIKPRTARFHIENAKRKHQVATRAQLIVKLMREGVLQ